MSQIEIKVPTVGESITEVTIGSWVKKDGETVKRDEVICSLDSDKASFEVVAEADGVLRIKAQEGDVLPIGGLICVIETSAAAPAPAPTQAFEQAVGPTHRARFGCVKVAEQQERAQLTPKRGGRDQP